MTKIQKKFNEYIVASAELVKFANETEITDDFDEKLEELNNNIDNVGSELSGENNDFSVYDDRSGILTIDNLELEDYIKSIIGKDYFDDRRCWSYLYDSIIEIMNYMPIPDENIIYEDVELNKDYIIEGIYLKKGNKIKIEENVESPLVGTFTDDDFNNQLLDMNEWDIRLMASHLVEHLKDLGYLDESNDDYTKNYEKVIDFCTASYQKYFKMPSFADIENLAKETFNEPMIIDNKNLG